MTTVFCNVHHVVSMEIHECLIVNHDENKNYKYAMLLYDAERNFCGTFDFF